MTVMTHRLEDFLEDFGSSASRETAYQQSLRQENRALLRDVKRLLARRLHPDLCSADAEERTIRAAIFQEIWPELERLGRDRA